MAPIPGDSAKHQFGTSMPQVGHPPHHSKLPLVFYRFDGTYLLITAMMQKAWSVSDWYFASNPLQGIGGLSGNVCTPPFLRPGWRPACGWPCCRPFSLRGSGPCLPCHTDKYRPR